ncbi:MAG: TolC family protein, partial [Candidatus Omnitrophica bacterium]|nr:TolC family protein [Candidatus Omnitrophota bacterium]
MKGFLNLFIPVYIILFLFGSCYAETLPAKPEEKIRLITIGQGIEMTLKNNHLIKVALPDNEMSYQDSLISRSALLPNVNLTATKQYFRFQPASKIDNSSVNTAEKDPFSFGIDVYQTLFDFGKSLSNFRASKELFKATKAHTESVKRVATLEFIVSYFNLLEAEKMIVVAEKEVESLSSYLNDVQHLYEQGVVVKNDLLPAKVKLADAKQKLITALNAKEVIMARLNNILALPLREKVTAQDIEMQP